MRTIIMRRNTKAPRTGSGLTIESVGVGPIIEPAGSGGPPIDLGFTMEIVDASMDEALKHPDTLAVGNPDMPMDLLEPFSSTGSDAARPASMSWGVEAVGAAASGLKETGKGVTVAVLDTGIHLGHEAFSHIKIDQDDMRDFTGKLAPVNEAIRDELGHGTHCAGTIFGGEVDGVRIGVAPGVQRVIVGKIIGGTGGTAETIINAVNWAYGRGAQVISLSVGQNFNLYFEQLKAEYKDERRALSAVIESYVANVRLFDALSSLMSQKSALHRGSVLVAAAGNHSGRPAFTANLASPASGERFLSVAAVERRPDVAGRYDVARFSNRGARISAPGVGIWSAHLGGGIAPLDGTSMAAPHVAGVAALWIERLTAQANGAIPDADTVIKQIERSAIDLSGYLDRRDTGSGIVQAPRP